ncbi:MAG: ABC transporter ATP-binding protein [bacterium]|nr:ABC transporter ATP-binding protein [bacterium]
MALEFKGVTGKEKVFYLDDVNFKLEPGFLMGIAGKNGAGKTTLLNYMLDKQKLYSGEILYNDREIHKHHCEFLDQVGFLSDDQIFFKTLTARQNVELLSGFYSQWEIERFLNAMRQMNVSPGLHIRNMSKGEFLKFQMAFAMGHKAKLYLIDEATGGMDLVFRKEFFRLLRELLIDEEVTILMTTHIEEELKSQMDYIAIMENGQMISFHEAIEEESKNG